MSLDIFWMHLLLLGFILVVAYFMHVRTLRIKARFNLYRVRDKFILLIADDQIPLNEDSLIFAHYYGRINRLLQEEKPLGIDDILQMAFRKFKDGEFDDILKKAKLQVQKLADDPIAQHPAVRCAISDYYESLEMLILSHSSFLRFSWLLSKFVAGHFVAKAFAPFAPKKIRRGWAAVDYADHEARVFQPAC